MSFSSGVEAERCVYRTVSSAPPKKRSGRTKFTETRHPVYKGVRRRGTGRGRWVCELREPGSSKKSRIWVGTFPTAEMAARAHDVAAIALRGSSACLNFADSAWLLPVPSPSAGPRAIQRAAAEAARAFSVQSEPNNTCSTAEEEEEESSTSSSSSSLASTTETTKTAQPEIREEQRTADMGHDMIGLEMDLVMSEYYCYQAIFAEGLLLVDPSAAGDDDSDGGDMDLSLWSFPL